MVSIIRLEDFPSFNTTCNDVMKQTGMIDAGSSRHIGGIENPITRGNKLNS